MDAVFKSFNMDFRNKQTKLRSFHIPKQFLF